MFIFEPRQIPRHVIVIGCGGTGSRLVPLLTQFMRSISAQHNPQGWVPDATIHLIDGDVVEQKNLLRQNFIESDVGKNKASVLAQRYSRAYNMDVRAYPCFVKNVNEPTDPILENTDTYTPPDPNESFRDVFHLIFQRKDCIIILAVDSHQARKEIISILWEYLRVDCVPPFVIDAGNEDDFGQVKFFHLGALLSAAYTTVGVPAGLKSLPSLGLGEEAFKDTSRKTQLINIEGGKIWWLKKNNASVLDPCMTPPKTVPHIERIHTLPMDYRSYMDTPEEDEIPVPRSCADLDQTLAINAYMATAILGIVQNFYYAIPMNFNQINIGLNGSSYTTFNTLQNFLSKMGNTPSSPGDELVTALGTYVKEMFKLEAEKELSKE